MTHPNPPDAAATTADAVRDVLTPEQLKTLDLSLAMTAPFVSYDAIDIIRSLAARVVAAERERWVSMSERSPSQAQKVLIVRSRPITDDDAVTEAYWQDGCWDHAGWHGPQRPEYATHWREMPKPPNLAATQPGGVASMWGQVPAGESDAEFLRQVTDTPDTNETRAAPAEGTP